MSNPNTTGGPPPPGITWQALIFDSFTLAADTEIRMKNIPDAQVNLSVQPSIQMRPPSKFRLRFSPMIDMAGGNNEAAQFGVGVSPRIRWIPSAAFKAQITPMIAMGGKPKSSGLFGLTLTPSIHHTKTSKNGILLDAIGAGGQGITTTTFAHTVGTANLLLVGTSTFASGAGTLTVTCNGTAMTQVPSSSFQYYSNGVNSSGQLAFFYMFNPPAGACTIVVSFTGGSSYAVTANSASYSGVGSLGTASTVSGSSATPTQAVSGGTTKNVVFQMFGGYGNFSAYNQNQLWLANVNGNEHSCLIGHALGVSAPTFAASMPNTAWGGAAVPLIAA